jgi:hypothetical protein
MSDHEDTAVNVIPPEFAEFTKGRTRAMTRPYFFAPTKIILTLLVIGFLGACGGWSKRDTLRELAFTGVTSADWYQTNSIVQTCSEQNPIMGHCGQNIRPNFYMPAAIVLHALVSAALPGKYRDAWQYTTLGAEGLQVWSNYRNGWGWSSPPLDISTVNSVLVTKTSGLAGHL